MPWCQFIQPLLSQGPHCRTLHWKRGFGGCRGWARPLVGVVCSVGLQYPVILFIHEINPRPPCLLIYYALAQFQVS